MTAHVLVEGDRVRRTRGSPYPGVIVGLFTTTAGNKGAVVEATDKDYYGELRLIPLGLLEYTPDATAAVVPKLVRRVQKLPAPVQRGASKKVSQTKVRRK